MSPAESVVGSSGVRRDLVATGMIVLVLLELAGIAIGLGFGVRGGNLATLALCLTTAVLALAPVVYVQSLPFERRNVLLSLFCLAYVARFVVPPIILYVPERAPIDAPAMYMSQLRPWDVATGQLAVLVALVAFLAGHLVPLVRSLGGRIQGPTLDWSPAVTFTCGVVLILIGSPISLASTLGLIPASLGSGVISTLGSSLVFGHALLVLAYLRHGLRVALLFLAVTIPASVIVGFLSGSKTAAVLAPIFVALAYVFEKRRVPIQFVAGGALALAIMYPASEFLRVYMLGPDFRFTADVVLNPTKSTSQVTDYVQSWDVGEYLSEGFAAVGQRLDSTGVVSVIVRDTPRLAPYQYGATLVLFFESFVPRILWPEKPNIAIGQFITDVYGSGPEIESSTAPSQIGDFYLNFGYAGVVIGMFALGVAMRFAADVLLGRRSTAIGLLAAIAIAYSLIMGFEANVALAQARVFFNLVPIAGLHFLVRILAGRGAGRVPIAADAR